MRVIFDLQSLQTINNDNEIGRDALSLAKALLRHAGEHQLLFAVNQTLFDKHKVVPDFYSFFPDYSQFLIWQSLEKSTASEQNDAWRCEASVMIYEQFIQSHNPDLLHIPSYMEGYSDDAVTAIYNLFNLVPTVVNFHEPVSTPGVENQEWCQKKITELSKADRIITFSKAAKDNATCLLGDNADKVICFSKEEQKTSKRDWDDVAAALWKMYEQCLQNKVKVKHDLGGIKIKKPRIAYLSPLPPEKSGIADYSAEILPELSMYYDIDLVTNLDTISDPYLEGSFKKIKIDDFHKYADKYDRIIYHFGNSKFHVQLFHLLEKYPGIVVLHDFFIGGMFNYMTKLAPESHILYQQLFESHGYHVLSKSWNNIVYGVWNYPINRQIIEMSSGVIVHSRHAMELCKSWYGESVTNYVKRAILPRKVSNEVEREEARNRLGICDGTFLVCSFGYIGTTKLNDRLLAAWFSSDLLSSSKCLLVFVGEGNGRPYEVTLRKTIDADGKGNIKITGFVSSDVYNDYLAAADIGVQLRSKSRGETSISILDGMAHALPMLVNAHGAFAELPEGTVYKLQDKFSDRELREGLETLYKDNKYRSELGIKGLEYVKTKRSLALATQTYIECIEKFYHEHPVAQQCTLINNITKISNSIPTVLDIERLACVINENNVYMTKKQLFVDVSNLQEFDHKTGIQRVVRSVLQQLLANTPEGYRVEPVYRVRNHYRYARKFTCRFLGVPDEYLDDLPIELSQGDIFLGLDLDIGLSMSKEAQRFLIHHKQRGVKFIYVIYDILPSLKPDYFPTLTGARFQTWFQHVVTMSDGLACISRSVADEVDSWLNEHSLARPSLGYFHLGADIVSSKYSTGMSNDDTEVLNSLEGKTVLLMVGTVEPRKGYAKALSAMEQVWKCSSDVVLVIVGGIGWMVDPLVSRIRKHPELGHRLLWLENASDELLMKLYDVSSSLLMASEGEGFGLPLIEAAQHGLPIISRNLPVFCEVAGEHAYYFSNDEQEALAKSILDWLELYYAGEHPRSDGLMCQTWKQGAEQLLDIVINEQWYINA